LADLFDMQDEIVTRLARQLGTKLVDTEAQRSERRPNPDSLDLRFQGLAWFYKGRAPEDLARAGVFFERALALDPGNIEALVGGAAVDVVRAVINMTNDRYERLAAAEAALSKALSLAPNIAGAHHLMGVVQIFTNRVAQGISECERALALDRNLSIARADIGYAKMCIGRAEETEVHIQEALRVSPRDSQAYVWMLIAGGAKLFLGSDEEAIAWLRRSVEANRNNPQAHFYLAAALAHLGWLEEARAATQAGLALNPTFTVRRHQAGAFSDDPIYLAQRERVTEGMRKAGVPEGDQVKSRAQQA
jgi:tetratricopeptide (TPR) repeat protein